MSRRERIGSRYISRRKDGTFSKNVDIGRSISADKRQKAKTSVKAGAGQGDKGDIKRADFFPDGDGRNFGNITADAQYEPLGANAEETMNAQGYDDKLDESLGGRDGAESTKSQSDKARRDESKGMEKSMGRRPYSGVRTMDAEDRHPNLSKEAKSAYVFPKRQAYPIGDLKHGKYALIFSTWPENEKNAPAVRRAVFKRYPQLRKWFMDGKYENKDVPKHYNAESFEARTYRKTPARQKSKPSKGKSAGKMRRHRKLMSARKVAAAEEFQADSPVEELKELDVVETTQRVVGKTGLNVPAGVASLAVLWIAFMTGKRYS